MIVNNLTIPEAIGACHLDGIITRNQVYYQVERARNLLPDRKLLPDRREGLLVECVANDSGDDSPLSEGSSSDRGSSSNQTNSSRSISLSTSKTSRKTSRQASKARVAAKAEKEENNRIYKQALKEATSLVLDAKPESSRNICRRLNIKYGLHQAGRKKLCKTTINCLAQSGKSGLSPMKRGPPAKIPKFLLDIISTHIEVCQVGSGELSGKQIRRLIGAAISGSAYEGMFNVETVWKKLRNDFPVTMQAATKLSVDDARAEWTTFENLNQWFDDAKRDLIKTGLVVDEPVLDDKGNVTSELNFRSEEVKRRIINMDETHHDLSITGDKSGSRAITYHNPNLQRSGKRAVKNARHVTGVYATNAAGESLPPMYIFDSSCKNSANYQVKMDWLVGLPKVTGRYGRPTLTEVDSYYAVQSKGSMDDSLLNAYVEENLLPLFPNISNEAVFDSEGKLLRGPVILKLDAGPGRMVASEESIKKREEFKEKGLFILLGLPNATAVQQEMDNLYGPFKSATYARGERVVEGKLKERAEVRRNGTAAGGVVTLSFNDLATVVNGKDGDHVDDRPFDNTFTKKKILTSWSNVGFVPFTRKCLGHKKVRSELGQRDGNLVLENLQAKYDKLIGEAEAAGFNPGLFDASIPVAQRVERISGEDDQVKALVEMKGAFSSSIQWSICSTRMGNSAVALRAQKELLAVEAAKVAAIEKKKDDEKATKLTKARAALRKYHNNVNSLSDKDWGDVLRWVIQAAGITVVLKDYKKKDAIIAKLESLQSPWTSYIPPSDEPAEELDTLQEVAV